ncbi:unnamed protein product, partial [Mesorhabditis spiculigera]
MGVLLLGISIMVMRPTSSEFTKVFHENRIGHPKVLDEMQTITKRKSRYHRSAHHLTLLVKTDCREWSSKFSEKWRIDTHTGMALQHRDIKRIIKIPRNEEATPSRQGDHEKFGGGPRPALMPRSGQTQFPVSKSRPCSLDLPHGKKRLEYAWGAQMSNSQVVGILPDVTAGPSSVGAISPLFD